MKFIFVLATVLVQWPVFCQCAQILMLSPMGTRSHMYSFMPIMEALAERGHNITVVTAHAPKTKSLNINKIVISEIVEHLEKDWQKMGPQTFSDMLNSFMDEAVNLGIIGYGIFMNNEKIREIMRNNTFELVVVDAIMNEFTFPFIDYLGVPFIFHSASTGPPWSLAAFDVSQEYARFPSLASEFKSQMTFIERLINMLSVEVFLTVRKVLSLRMLDELAKKDFPNARPVEEIERSAELCLASSHPTTAYPRPLPPTFVAIGALHVRPPHPLPEDLKTFADGANDGFIVFTLGSNAKVSTMPENIKQIFIRVFARLPQRVFWKWETEMEMSEVSPNVKLVDWLPQQDLLGHEKARLFISHGGLLGTQETIYHGVPILGLPLGRDQRSNLALSEEQGYAIRLDWADLTESILYDAIQTLLHDPTYKGNATRLSRLMRDELVPARDVAAYWVEHVLRHGGTKHLQPKVKDMPFYQVYLLDVLLFLFIVISIPPILVYKLVSRILRRLISNKNEKKRKTH